MTVISGRLLSLTLQRPMAALCTLNSCMEKNGITDKTHAFAIGMLPILVTKDGVKDL